MIYTVSHLSEIRRMAIAATTWPSWRTHYNVLEKLSDCSWSLVWFTRGATRSLSMLISCSQIFIFDEGPQSVRGNDFRDFRNQRLVSRVALFCGGKNDTIFLKSFSIKRRNKYWGYLIPCGHFQSDECQNILTEWFGDFEISRIWWTFLVDDTGRKIGRET